MCYLFETASRRSMYCSNVSDNIIMSSRLFRQSRLLSFPLDFSIKCWSAGEALQWPNGIILHSYNLILPSWNSV